jgi:hypothetical protein
MLLVSVVVMSALPVPVRAEDAKEATPNDLNELSLEVTALQMLYQFQFTPAQMDKIRQCAKESAEKGRHRQAGQASKEFQEKLHELHKALVRAADTDLIDQLSDELDELRHEEEPLLEDDVKPTKEARKHAPAILRLLKANQYAAYAALLVEMFDPLDLLTESLPKVRELKGEDWRQQRKKIAAEIGRLVGGVDAAKEEQIKKEVAALLTRCHKLDSQDFEDQRGELDEAARQIIGAISPADVIRNEIEYTIAELLSNVRLAAALAARLRL